MKWLLITTATRTSGQLDSNVGDEFTRLGIQKLILEVDPAAEFDVLDKEDSAAWDKEHPFDRAVICGMPLFWSNENQTCSDIYWWEYIWNSYVAGERDRLLPMGVGHVLIGHPHDAARYQAAIKEVTKKSWHVVAREPIYGQPDTWIEGICPSAFCNLTRPQTPTHNLCNFMPGGGHFGYLTSDGKAWDDSQAQPIAEVLLSAGFEFVAHTEDEAELAKTLGWPATNIHLFDSAQKYIDLYANAASYFGNRLHGAVLTAAQQVPTWAVTHDSRLGMVARLGGKATRTSGVKPEWVRKWIIEPTPPLPEPRFVPGVQYQKMLRLMKLFAAGS